MATLRPASASRSFAAPAVLGNNTKTSGSNAQPDYLSKGYSTAGFGGPDRICIEVGNHWEPVPEIHARLACQCGAIGAKTFPTTVEEWSDRLDLLTDQGALRMSTDQRAHKATDHGLQVLRDALAARRKMYGTTIRDLKAVFDSIDTDGSGALDHKEFATAMHRLGLGLAKEQIQDIINRLDQDGDGEIDYCEFAAELAARPLPESSALDGDAAHLPQRGPPLPAGMLAKYQYAADTTILNTNSWTVVVRDASGASLSNYISHVEFRLPEDSGFDETVILCYEEPYEISRIGHSKLKVLITIHLCSGGGYCFEHQLSFAPGQRTDGGGHNLGGKIRRVHFQPVKAPQLEAEIHAAKEHDASEWWAEHEAGREKLANHPRFPGSSPTATGICLDVSDVVRDGNAGNCVPSQPIGVWTEGMKQANAAIRNRTNQLQSEHAQALSELKSLQVRLGQQLTEEETQQSALAREQRKVEAAKLREQWNLKEQARKAQEAKRARLSERTRAENDALSILHRAKYSKALGRRSREFMHHQRQQQLPARSASLRGHVGDVTLNDPHSVEYQAIARDLEQRTATDSGSKMNGPGTGGTLASLRAAGEISPQRIVAEVEARSIVQDAAILASHEHAMAMANAQADADERLEIEASEAPRWSEWKGLKSGGVEIALANETLFQMAGNMVNEDKAMAKESTENYFGEDAVDVSASSTVLQVGDSERPSSMLDDALSKIEAEIEAMEQMHVSAEADAKLSHE